MTRAMTMIEDREKLGLALCPFCGGAARFGKCVPGEQEGENDIVECHRCGRQWTVPCNFDEDYS